MDELNSLIDQFKKTYSLSQNNLKPCGLFKGKLDNESFPILPPLPSFLSLSSDKVIRLFCEVAKPGTDNFVSKVYEITSSGILCQLIYQIGPVKYQDLSKLQIFGLIPFDMISPGVIKKIKALCRSNSSLHFLEIAQMKQTLVNSHSSSKVDFDPEIDTYNTQKLNNVTNTKPLLILSISKNDKEVERSNDFNQISLVQMNFYRSLFEPSNDCSKELEDETNDYTTLIQMHPSFHNLSCYSNLLQTEKINVRGTLFTFLKDFKNVEYLNDCSTFAATLRKKQAHSWALPSIKKGIHYFNTSRNPEALQCYNKALQIDPTNAEALVARGAMYATCLNFDKAVQDFSEALSHDPNHGNAHKYLGQTLVTKAKRLEKELGKLEKKKKLLEAIDEENERATVARIKILRSQIGNYYYQASIHMPESESVKFKLKEFGIITGPSANEQRTSIMREGDGPSTPATTAVEGFNEDDSDVSSATSQNSSASSVTTSSSQTSGSDSSVSSRSSSSESRSPSITSVSTRNSSGEASNKRQKRVKKGARASPYTPPPIQHEVVEASLDGNLKRFKYSPQSLNKSKRDFTPRSDSLTPSPIILLPSPDEDPEFWFQNMNWGSPLLTNTSPHYPRDYRVEEQSRKNFGNRSPHDEHYSCAENNRKNTKSSEKKRKYASHQSAHKFKSEDDKKRPDHRQNNFNKNFESNTKRQSDKGEKKDNKELQDMESFLETLKRRASTTSTISK